MRSGQLERTSMFAALQSQATIEIQCSYEEVEEGIETTKSW